MSEPATLGPIVYEPVYMDGARIGWRVPEDERERWDNPPPRATRPAGPLDVDVKPLTRIVSELEAWVLIDDRLERELSDVYDADPRAVTRAAVVLVNAAEAGRLRAPGGFLHSLLRNIHRS